MNWFKKQEKIKAGALEDPRNEEELKKDYKIEEVKIAKSINWPTYEEYLKSLNHSFNSALRVHNQNGSGSCVANACAMIATINNVIEEQTLIHFSPRWMYAQRMNRPGEGMFFNNAAELYIEKGFLMDQLCPGDHLSEEKMNELPESKIESFSTIASIYKTSAYFWLPKTIDAVADILATGLPVLLGFRFGSNEWNKEVPTVTNSQLQYGHAVTALPHSFFIYNGKKAIMIIDSWGVESGNKGRRIITEDWFTEERCMAAIVFVDMKNPTLEDKKYPKLTKDLGYGDTGEEVLLLQEIMKNKYGIFKLNPTGNYYGYTVSCVKELQKLLNVTPITGYFGPLTRKALNKELNKK